MNATASQSNLQRVIVESPQTPVKNSDLESNDDKNIDTDTVICNVDSFPIQDISDFKKYYSSIKGAYHGEVSYESITLDLIAIYLKPQDRM